MFKFRQTSHCKNSDARLSLQMKVIFLLVVNPIGLFKVTLQTVTASCISWWNTQIFQTLYLGVPLFRDRGNRESRVCLPPRESQMIPSSISPTLGTNKGPPEMTDFFSLLT